MQMKANLDNHLGSSRTHATRRNARVLSDRRGKKKEVACSRPAERRAAATCRSFRPTSCKKQRDVFQNYSCEDRRQIFVPFVREGVAGRVYHRAAECNSEIYGG